MSAFKKLDHVDALRGLAILAVVLVHNAQHGTNEYNSVIDNVFSRGGMGVQLFYVMSAFTLFLSCTRREGREHQGFEEYGHGLSLAMDFPDER